MNSRASKIFIFTIAAINVIFAKTILDYKFSPFLRMGRNALNQFISPKNLEENLKVNMQNNKLQKQFSSSTQFFCVDSSGSRSKTIPTSVHKLRPGDIDIIAAIGDSLTAANGIFAVHELQVLLEGRGASWSIGGQGSWREFLTLPNILKEFNPNLYGYAIEDSTSYQKASKFNVAEPGAMSQDTLHQSKNLVKRMRSDKNVNIKQHWKMVTHLIGGNDFCLDICYHKDQNKVIEAAANDLITVLRILRENLPRTLVNVVLPPDVSLLTRIPNKPLECQALHYIECPCMFSLNQLQNRERTISTINRWKKRIAEVVNMPEFHDRMDFEVTLVPFLDRGGIPKFPDGNTDLSYMSKDCFHLSQKGHSTIANALWNSLLTPPVKRLHSFKREFEEFKCPTREFPYLATTKNS